MSNFDDVKAAERDELREARTRRGALFAEDKLEMPAPDGSERVGLAFSGGGIRSATFNLGILQGLARYNLLQRIDYISTVSGGGYIGSWLISWIRRSGLKEVVTKLASSPPSPPVKRVPPPTLMPPAVAPPGGTYTEAEPINFLRDYSNYLTPRLGAFSADVWAAVASYFRNLLLNLSILVLSLSAVLLLPRFWEALFLAIATGSLGPLAEHYLCLILAIVALMLIAIVWASWNIASHSFSALLENSLTEQKWVLLSVVAPLFVAAPLGSIALWLDAEKLQCITWGYWVLYGSLAFGLLRVVGLIGSEVWLYLRGLRPDAGWWQEFKDGCWLAGFAFVAGPLGGVLFGWIVKKFWEWAPLHNASEMSSEQVAGVAKVACWGTPLLIGALLLTGVLHIGLMSLSFSNQKREWWARMTGWLIICCLAGTGLFWLGIYAPIRIMLLSVALKSALSGGWLLSTIGGLFAGKSGSTSGTGDSKSKLELVAKIAPYVFVVGLLAALSLGIHKVIPVCKPSSSAGAAPGAQSAKVSGEMQLVAHDTAEKSGATLTELKLSYSAKPADNKEQISKDFWNDVGHPRGEWSQPWWAVFFFASLLLFIVALAFSARVDINEFSMHLLYRNRLVRCYLGASNKDRNAQRFSGFDPNDDELLAKFSVFADPYGKIQYAGPYPILNCTLSLTHGERLAWQERKGESFVFTPRYCGYEFQEQYAIEGGRVADKRKDQKKANGFQPTKEYAYPDGGVYLGTALATSGAAVNPNMGFHTSAPLAFLMTVFNVRLGWWLGNPQHPGTWQRSTPLFGLFYLLMELFASTNDRSRYVNLSDGFHFENLGLYELVRRRCTYIVVGDAGADPQHSFDDLGNAIRKCRTDFGVEIEIDLGRLRLPQNGKYSRAHSAVGTIHYELLDPTLRPGKLVYFKPTLTGDDPVDVQNYKTLHPDFPHQSTANQWFDESQFESYRELGRVSAESTLEKLGSPEMLAGMTVSDIFNRLS